MKTDYLVLQEERNVSLTVYLQEVGGEFRGVTARPAVLILPGGGYMFCSDREAEPVALRLLALGVQAVIVRYSVAPARYPTALKEAAEAVAKWMLTEEAQEIIMQAYMHSVLAAETNIPAHSIDTNELIKMDIGVNWDKAYHQREQINNLWTEKVTK